MKEAEPEAYYEDSVEVESSKSMMRASSSEIAGNAELDSAPVPDNTNTNKPPEADSRKRVYNASAGIVLDDPEKTRLEYEQLAVDYGGYVESSYSYSVVLRVPVRHFEEVLDAVLASGRVEFSRVESYDVTDSYADIERQLQTAQKTRERLYVLLEKSTKSAERAKILREIGRLTEEIESLKQQISLMDSRISFSSISIQLIPRIGGELTRSDIPFKWIAVLDPTVPAGERLRASVDLELDDDWAVFSKEYVFMAENSSRENVIISTVKNSPSGDSLFWQNALEHHLKPFYASLKKKDLDGCGVYGVEVVSKDQYPFRYFVGVEADGNYLNVVEIFSPNSEKGFEKIYAAFEKGEIR